MKRTINTNEINGFISAQQKSANSITFVGELPKGTDVSYVRLIGEVEVNGTKFVNPVINNIDGVTPVYHIDDEDGAIATAYFVEGIPEKLRTDVLNGILYDFEVVCEVCPYCGK